MLLYAIETRRGFYFGIASFWSLVDGILKRDGYGRYNLWMTHVGLVYVDDCYILYAVRDNNKKDQVQCGSYSSKASLLQ